ncbi:tail fiber protein [Polynucleobacter sp. JS-Safj-400b-B2]|nr:tail fiber protein [Polynucleobacter sp. JS-Safj-400b-B2]
MTFAMDTGTVNAYKAQYNPPVTQPVDGMLLSFKAKNTNTGAATFSPNGLAASTIYSQAHVALLSGEIAANGFVEVEWNSTLNGWVLCENTGGIAHGTTPTAGDNSQKLATTAFVQAAAAAMLALSGAPGSVSFFANTSAPSGWLKANGAAISRSTYSALFSAIGITFGAGDGTTTFNLPDLRGEFLRAYDDSRGIDSGRTFGSWQKGSAIAANAPQSENLIHGLCAGTGSDTGQTHRAILGYDDDANSSTNYSGSTEYAISPASAGTNSGDWMHGVGWGGGVSRPRNVALLACIKF